MCRDRRPANLWRYGVQGEDLLSCPSGFIPQGNILPVYLFTGHINAAFVHPITPFAPLVCSKHLLGRPVLQSCEGYQWA